MNVVKRLIFGMKAHFIDTHILVPRSRLSAKVKVKYQGHVSQKTGVSGALVFHKHILESLMDCMVFSTVFQFHCGSQCTYQCFPGALLTNTPHNILLKPLALFPQNHR